MAQFNESEHSRDRGGRFVSKGPAAEEDGVRLEDPAPGGGGTEAWEDARAALQPGPKGESEYLVRDISCAIHPGLDPQQRNEYIAAMQDEDADHELAHRTAGELSEARLTDKVDYNRMAIAQRGMVGAATRISEKDYRDDPRVAPAFRAMTPDMSEEERTQAWGELVTAADNVDHVAETAEPAFTDEADYQVRQAINAHEDAARKVFRGHSAFRYGTLRES